MEGTHIYPCESCKETFSENNMLLKHHHVFPCEHCDAIYTSRNALLKNATETHSIYCIDCDMKFPTNTEMDNHMQSNHGATIEAEAAISTPVKPSPKPSSVQLSEFISCEKEFLSRTELKNHKDNVYVAKCLQPNLI
jgi:hypothetical protein